MTYARKLNHPQPTDRRDFGRRDTFKRAMIVGQAGERVACVVVNLSRGGALLQVDATLVTLELFDLLMEEDDILISCRVAHRARGKMGVQFLRSPRRASRVGSLGQQRAQSMVRLLVGK
ncbi:MAG: PilZ domain-containing protein [Hyphomicrobiaceae bacterium]